MALSLSSAMMQALGFRQMAPGETVAGVFNSLHAYEVQGFILEEGALPPVSGSIGDISYAVAVGSSLNEICRELTDDDFTDDEGVWRQEHNCSSPFLLIRFGPTREHSCTSGHVREEESGITTYDCFPGAREELKTQESRVLPSFISALASTFNVNGRSVRFRPVDRTVFGVTADGTVIHDIRLVMSATAYAATRMRADDIRAALGQTISTASQMNLKVARFFHLALQEDDPLKKFLYFFLAIEIETHATFKSINHSTHLVQLVNGPPRVRNTTQAFFEGQRERWTTLKDRFVWCVLSVWTNLTDADVDDFKRLKKIRDEIAHGSLAAPPDDAVRAAERLAAKLQCPTT